MDTIVNNNELICRCRKRNCHGRCKADCAVLNADNKESDHIIFSCFCLPATADSKLSKRREQPLNSIQYWGRAVMAPPPLQFSLISPERLKLRPSNFLTLVSTYWLSEKYKYVIFRLHLLPWQPFCREYFD